MQPPSAGKSKTHPNPTRPSPACSHACPRGCVPRQQAPKRELATRPSPSAPALIRPQAARHLLRPIGQSKSQAQIKEGLSHICKNSALGVAKIGVSFSACVHILTPKHRKKHLAPSPLLYHICKRSPCRKEDNFTRF